jgi:CRP-like cAMP-binding protein
MTRIEKLLALRNTPSFERLRDMELALIAEVAREKHYVPGDLVIARQKLLNRLYVVVQGEVWSAANRAMPAVIGAESLLFDIPATETLIASRETGAVCLLISKAHFFTIVNECPSLVIGFLVGSDKAHGT